jgi:predicted amidohydrolase
VKLTALARELGIAIVLGFPERDGSAFFNSAVAIAADGEPAFYRKCHLYGEPERKSFCSGSTVSPIVTVADFRVGMLICYDVEFPEWVRVLALAGVDLIAVPTALPRSDANRRVARSMIRARALENGVFIAYAGLCGEDTFYRYQGMSAIVGPDGEDLARGGAAPCLLIADLDRSRYPAGEVDPYLEDRRCEIYKGLLR